MATALTGWDRSGSCRRRSSTGRATRQATTGCRTRSPPCGGCSFPELTPDQLDLSRQIIGYWAAFARDGDPNTAGLIPWAELDPDGGTVQSLAAGDGGIAPVDLARNHHCDLWLTR